MTAFQAINSAYARMKLMFVEDELVWAKAELTCAPVGSEAHDLLVKHVAGLVCDCAELETEIWHKTGTVSAMDITEAVAWGLVAAVIGAVFVSGVVGLLIS